MKIEELGRKRQLDVQEQNALSKDKISGYTRQLQDTDGPLAWLRRLTARMSGEPSLGVLVYVGFVPEQDGEFVSGLWLSEQGKFYKFEATLPRHVAEGPRLEVWEDVTAETDTSLHVPGRGKSVAALALELLNGGGGVA